MGGASLSLRGGLGGLHPHIRHDLRTPLSAVIGYSELLLEEANDEGAVAESLRSIRRAGQQLLSQVNERLEPSVVKAAAEGDLRAFFDELRASLAAPTDLILARGTELLEGARKEPDRGERTSDLARVIDAARRFRALAEERLIMPGASARDGDAGAMSALR